MQMLNFQEDVKLSSVRLNIGFGDVTDLICLDAFRRACTELEEAQRKCRQAAHVLTSIREELERALGHAYREQSFAPLDPLFSKEEAALVLHEQAAAERANAEERWCALRVALAYEEKLAQERQLAFKRLN